MKKLIATGLMALGLLAAVPSKAIMIDFAPASPFTVTAGSTLNVDVVVSGLGGQIVSAFDLDVLFDSTTLASTGITFGSLLGNAALFEVLESTAGPASGPGVLDFASASLLSDADLVALQGGTGGTFTLATLGFNVLADGVAPLSFSWTAGNDIKGLGNQPIYPTPVPSTLALALLGLAGLIKTRHAQRTNQS